MVNHFRVSPGFLLLIFVLLSLNLFAQQQSGFEIEISLNKRIIPSSAKEKVKLKITNLATADFETKNIKYVSFYLLKWGSADFYIADKDLTKIVKKNKFKILKQNESFEFEVRLNKLKWRDRLESAEKDRKKFKRLNPAVYDFYAVVDVDFRKDIKANQAEKHYGSNTLAVKLTLK